MRRSPSRVRRRVAFFHSSDFHAIASAFHIPFKRCTTEDELSASLREAPHQSYVSIIEMCVPEKSLKSDLPPLLWSITQT